MKILFKLYLLFFVINTTCYASSFDVTKSKKISKEFKTVKDVTVKVDNKYGSVSFELWDKNTVEYTVDVTVSSTSEKNCQELLDNIQVLFTEGTTMVHAATNFKSSLNYNKDLHIKYLVKIPKNAKVNVDQKYGNITVPELYNSLTLVCKYGSVFIGKLHHKTNDFKMDYVTSSKIENVNQIHLEMKYSTLQIEKAEELDIIGNYNTLKLNTIGNLQAETKYTTLKVNEVKKVEISGNYLNIDLQKVIKSVVLNSNYSTLKLNVDRPTELIKYNGNYSNVYVNNLDLTAFEFEIKGNYSHFKPNMDLDYSLKSKENTSILYKGFNKKNPKLNLEINGNYTNTYFKK